MSFLVSLHGECYGLFEGSGGSLHVETFDPINGATSGWIESTLRPVDGEGATVNARLEYSIEAATSGVGINPLFDDLCEPPRE